MEGSIVTMWREHSDNVEGSRVTMWMGAEQQCGGEHCNNVEGCTVTMWRGEL